ncbi:MAG TPA: NAD(P)-dependent oxidoreductase [Bacillota bacterium]|nr:NAD(P)-dependent oxidoreductase [Bacillota bacterium]
MTNGIVISASGEKSFNQMQIAKLQAGLRVDFYMQKVEFSEEQFVEIVSDYEIIGITRRPLKDIGAGVLERLTKLKGISIFSTGYEWIDCQFLNQHGIKVAYLPEYSTVSVAEHTIGLLLVALRRIHLSHDYARNRLNSSISLRGYELYGKKIGIIGFGRIGQKVMAMLEPFGVCARYYDKALNKQQIIPGKFQEWDTLLSTSDIIVICASKERGMPPIIRAAEIGLMKKGVTIINSARADLVDNEAIINGIKSQTIFTYAVDDKLDIFQKADIETGRIIETGHTAWYSTEAIARGIDQWVDNIVGLATGNYQNLIGG